MNKRCVALSDEQYRESIRLLREGFVLEGKIIKPNPRIATVAVLQASLGLRLGDVLQLICNDLLSRENLQGVTTNLFNCY